ncbi:MAG: ESPR-type extended signal peptide-containing protein [Veillonella sp.]|uniref:ESPR-type extended signal peptide-containing protein n=1 Tax=Veillonella sp. TaxID=1926307 RepID=UPI0029078B79|nr:ESPR-type extended signal peptide-containing protein [Veillonella sp.]MDU4712583.1 ESPR-type extended signal peptide-containing protein [Veillonella sp.]
MNKIFKVIWSKSKQCYVVVSEMAKNKTGKKKIIVASILAALAIQTAGVIDVAAAEGDQPSSAIADGRVTNGKTNGLAIGNFASSESNQSIAIGYYSVATAAEMNPALPATAVGAGAKANGLSTVALGLLAQAKADSATALGSKTSATGDKSVAVGISAAATADSATALGSKTSATGDRTVAVGSDANATGRYAGAFGADASAVGNATAVGAKSIASQDAAVAVGTDSKATGNYASALGADATASGNDSTAFGHGTVASGASSTALGSRAKAGSVAGVGIGMLANATNQYGIAIGGESSSTADNSIAIGRNSSVTGDNGIAIGTFTTSKGANGVAIGTNSTTSDQGGVAVGNAAKSTSTNTTAVGMDVTAAGPNSVALGGSATASSDGAIAIGSHGTRKTTATGNRALAIGTVATANGLDNIAIGTSASTSSQYSTAVGNSATATAVRAAAFGANSTASVEGGVALGSGSVANRAGGIANKGYNPNDNRTNKYAGLNTWALYPSTGAIAVGNGALATRQITGLAAGKEDTDAVNVAQLKSVNLAFAGNVGSGDVNLANSTLGIKGDNTYITTSANGQNLTISGKTQNINVTNGQASAPAAGMADAKNVAEAINKAVSANAYNWKLAADNDNGRSEVINKEDTVSFSGDNNITVARNGKKITTSLNKAITVDTVKANKSVTVSSGGNQITLDGSNGAVTGKTFTGQSFTAGNNVLSNTTLQIGPTTGNNVTITTDGLSGKAGSNTVKFGTNGISAGGQQITNVSSGGNVGTNAANITDVKNAVSDVTLRLDTNSKTGSVKLSESPLKVIGANGIRTDLVGTNNGSLVVGLDNNTVNATTKGIGLTGDTGSTGLKYLKDGDATFKVAGDGNLVTTKASTTGVQVAVDSGKVKDLAVGAVTVSKANTIDNPITITPTAGTNTKDYAIGIDTTKLANQTQLTYKANGANENKVSLAKGLNFTNGTFTTATVGANGNVTISTATETITNDADGKAKVASPTDGLATAKNVAESINKAVDGLSQNLTVSDGTTDGTVNLKNQKLTVSGTNGVTATVNGQTVTVGLDAATKSKVDNASTVVNRNISLGADSGTPSSQSLKDGDVVFNVKGATGDFVSTKMNGDTVEVSTKRAAIDSNATTGAASVTGDDGIATAKNVADAINKASDAAKASAAWNLSANGDTGTKVSGGDTVDFTGDNNITVTQTGKNIATTLNKDLKDLSTISLTNPRGESIFLDGGDGTIKAYKAEFKDNNGAGSSINSDILRFTNGATGANAVETALTLNTLSIQAGPNSTALTSQYLMFSDVDGNNAEGSAKGFTFQSAAGKQVQFGVDEIKAGGNKIQEVAEGTADTDAVNVKQLKDTVASQTLTYRANTVADTDAKTVKLSKGLDFVDGTMTKATVDNDGKVIFDINDDTKAKINDSAAAVNRKVSLGADSGTVSSQSLKDGDVAFNVKGATGDFVSTKMNGNTVEVSTKRATIDSNDTTGAASVTGDDGLATAKNVADAINKAASQAKDGAAWNLSTNGDAGTKVSGGDTVDFTGDNNITVDHTNKNVSVKLNKDLEKLSSISLENKFGETVKIDGSDGSIKAGDIDVGNITAYSAKFKNSGDITKIHGSEISITSDDPDDVWKTVINRGLIGVVTEDISTTIGRHGIHTYDTNGTKETLIEPKGLTAVNGDGKSIEFNLDKISAGGMQINDVAEGTADTDAVNVKQLKDTVASQTLTYRANTAADTDAKTVKLSKGLDFVDGTMTKATVDNDGKVTFDINDDTKAKINDSAAAVNRKVSLGADSGTVSSQSLKDGDVAFNVKGATGDFISTKMNGDTVEVSTKRATIDSNATTGAASVTGDDGLATAKNVADAINKAAKASSDAVNLKFSGDTNTSAGVVNLKDDTFGIKGDGKYVTTDADGKNLTVKVSEEEVKKSAVGAVTVSTDTTDANNPLTVTGTTSADGTTKDYKVTIDGTKVAAKTNLSYKANDGTAKQVSLANGLNFKNGNMTTASIDDAGVVKYDVNTETITAGADGTITGPAKDGVATAKNVADAINAAKKSSKTEITANDGEAADGTTGNVVLTSSKAADGHTIYDVKLNDKVTLGTGANAVTLDGTTGMITGKTATIGGVTVDGTNKYVTGLGNTTWNGTATTGRAATEDQLKTVADAAKASTDAVNLKFSGDTNTSAGVVNLKDDTFGIKGDGKYVTTDADGKNLTVKVSEEEVKKSAVGAVTVSTDTTDADNPLTVTGTTSADGTTKDYKVTIDGTKVAAKTNLSYKANDGTAKQVSLADGLNFKNGNMTTASIDDAGVVKYDVNTETITAGADGTITGPATDGVATAKNVADAINAAKKATKTEITANGGEAADGTTGNVVLTSSKAADGHTIYDVKLNDKVTLGTGANAVTIDGTTGAITGKTANIGGVTVDGTNKYVTGLGNTTWNGTATTGRAATEDQLKAVADAAASQTWQITADKDTATSGIQTGTKKDAKVGKDAKVKMIAGENITINQNELDFTYSLNKDLVNMNSASFNGTGGNTTVINGDSITQTAGTQTNTSTAAGNTVVDGAKSTATTAAGTTITDGTKTNTATADSTVIDDGNGNNTALTKDGVTITTAGKDKVSLTGNGLDNGNNKIVNVADGTNDTDAVNVRQLEAKTKASTTELTANGGESAGSTTGNIVLTKKTAADGHIIYDNKLNDKVTLGTDPTKAVTVDGTNGTIKAGDGTNAVAIDGKNGSVKAGDKIALDGKDGKATIGTVGIDGKDGVISGLANKTWDPNNITPGRAATEDQVKSAVADAGWDAAVGTEGSGVNSTPSVTAEKVKPNETLTFKAGNNMMVSQNGKSISYAVNPELTDMKSATFKDADGNTTVTNGNGMTITPGSANPNNPNAGTISLTKDGLNNGNNQLKGIAPGTDDTDAVNVSQLKASNSRIGDAIGQVAGEVQRVGAHAAAMAALKPIQYDPLEPTQVMAGVGNYRGETAAALGLAHYTNEDTMFNVGVSLGANRNMVNAGVTHKFGSSPEKKNIPDRYKAGPISSVYVMQDEVSSLKKENSEQKTVIADQAARLNTLEAENERQRQELAETKQGLEDLRAAVNQLLASKG